MKRHVPSTTAKELSNPNQILVKTDKRHYWCTKCATVYLNLISLYTESHYRQCVGEDQRFNVIEDPSFFANEDILQQLPSDTSSTDVIPISSDSTESSTNPSRKKDSIFFSKTSDDSRTYFINGRPIRMSTINRPVTVKDLRQQFQQQSSFNSSQNPSEEYIYQQRPTSTSRASRSNDGSTWSNEPAIKVIPTPRSFDTFGISSDEEDAAEKQEKKSSVKPEIEKTLVKRRYDSDYSTSTNTITSVGQDDLDTHRQGKSSALRKSQPISTARVSQSISSFFPSLMHVLVCPFFSIVYVSQTISFTNTTRCQTIIVYFMETNQ